MNLSQTSTETEGASVSAVDLYFMEQVRVDMSSFVS